MYNKYFEMMDEEKKEITKKECCNDKKILLIDYNYVCENCGVVLDSTENEDICNGKFQVFNGSFILTTLIKGNYSKQNRSLMRLQKWNNYLYKEITLKKSFEEIKKILEEININDLDIFNNACYFYQKIYQETSSRKNIKHCIYIYCIFNSCLMNKIYDINLFELLKDKKLSINNFNNAMNKLDKIVENVYFLHSDIPKYQKILKEKYQKDISLINLIIIFNKNIKNISKIKIKLNYSSILIFTIYNLLDNKDNFIINFNISKITMKKIYKLI